MIRLAGFGAAIAVLSISSAAASSCGNSICATKINFAKDDVLRGDDGLPPHPLQPFLYGAPTYPITADGNGLEMVEAHLSYWEGMYYMYSATWGCGGRLFVYAVPPEGNYPLVPKYDPGDYGADGNCGIKTYASSDLTSWEFVDFYQPDSKVANVTKPLVRFSEATGKYVLYMGGAGTTGIYYATSASPSGPWSNPPGLLQGRYLSHDFDVFVGPNGTHYIVTDPFENWIEESQGEAIPTWDIWVQELAPNLTSTINTPDTVAQVRSATELINQGLTLEASGAFYKDGYYYLVFGMTCQNCAGYIYYYYSENPFGPYVDGGMLTKDGCGGQNKGINVLPTPNGGSVIVAGVLGYRTGPTNYVYHWGNRGYIWHADNHQAASSTFFFPLEFDRDHRIKNYTCPPSVEIPLMDGAPAPAAPEAYQLDCRIRSWRDIVATYTPPRVGSTLEFPVWQRTDNLGPTTNAGPVLDGSLNVTITYHDGSLDTFSWRASNISWAPAKISMQVSDKPISKITLRTNATNGCYGTMVKPKKNHNSTYGTSIRGKVSQQTKAELYLHKW